MGSRHLSCRCDASIGAFPLRSCLTPNPAPEFLTRRRATEDERARPPPCDPRYAARGPALLRLRCERSVGRLPRARLRFRLRLKLRLRTYDPVKIGLDIGETERPKRARCLGSSGRRISRRYLFR